MSLTPFSPGTLRLDAQRDWFHGARRLPSPNCDDRPADAEISLVVVHGISLPPRSYGGPYIDQLFTNCLDPGADPYFAGICALRVSSHLLVDRSGQVTQYVPLQRRAWHAGKSAFRGRGACNDYSIGVELEGCDEEAYSEAQYRVTAGLLREIMGAWPAITPGRIVRHSDIAPGRKTDPGPAFDWTRFLALVGTHSVS
jgi:N-acetyl-anhydromuramoyl-L-alanine amidase